MPDSSLLLFDPDSFFDYVCDQCGTPVCERVQIMNLSLDYVDNLFCMSCLAQEQGLSVTEMATTAREYVQGRECFKTPWDTFATQARQCPLLPQNTCYCQDTVS